MVIIMITDAWLVPLRGEVQLPGDAGAAEWAGRGPSDFRDAVM